jgi:hypothetical protein
MRHPFFRALIAGALLLTTAGVAGANVCVSIDEPQDTLSSQDRVASLLLLARQFELAGEQVVSEGCTASYTLSHVKLGNVIIVTLSGPAGQREGKALGLDDLPSLYSQMVRSITTGRPMEGFNVVDRTNVTTAQAVSPRVSVDSFAYARLGYSGTFTGSTQGAPAMGFGYRAELDSFAVDVSFFNYQVRTSNSAYGPSGYYGSGGGFSGSFLKLEGLYFLKPAANASPYVGGGLSWGGVARSSGTATSQTSLRGSGLQGELTVGYELPRASTLRVFVQADATLPFYHVTSQTITFTQGPPFTSSRSSGDRRYVPSLAVSIGLGWQRNRK